MMSFTQRMSRLSLAYIEAVAAVAGYQVLEPKVDEDSIDGVLLGREGRRPRLEFQAKATGGDPLPDGETEFRFDLSIKNYNDLRLDDLMVPRILIVVRVPENEADWVSHSEAELAVRRCGYWHSLTGMPETENQTSRRVHIQRSRVFDPSALREMMGRVGRGETP